MTLFSGQNFTTHYDLVGTGPETVVMVTGTAYPRDSWAPDLVDGIADAGYRVLTYDHRHLGREAVRPDTVPPFSVADLAADAMEMIRGLELGPVHVFAHSMGTMVAQEMYLHDPFDVLTLGFMAGSAGGEKPVPTSELRVPPAILGELQDVGYEEFISSRHGTGFFTPGYVTDHHEELRDLHRTFMAGCPDVNVYLAHVAARTGHGASGRLGDISCPCLVVVGSEDLGGATGVSRLEMSRRLHQGLSDSKFVVLEGANHGLIWENVPQVLETYVDFLSERREKGVFQ